MGAEPNEDATVYRLSQNMVRASDFKTSTVGKLIWGEAWKTINHYMDDWYKQKKSGGMYIATYSNKNVSEKTAVISNNSVLY